MSFLKNIFNKKEDPINSYDDFWKWFQKNEKSFFKAVKENRNVHEDFLEKLARKLHEINGELYYSTGMFDDNTVELVFTVEGAVKNIIFVEELVDAAPKIVGWRFTKLKPALEVNDVNIKMGGNIFSKNNISFYTNDNISYPDEIDITIVHDDFNDSNKDAISNGTYIFLDNLLGELNFATTIDALKVIGTRDAQKELIPIEKLNNYLIWRQKEFIEKYEASRYDTENDNYAGFEAELKNGLPLLAVINTDLLNWDGKSSHPWMLLVKIKYKGENNNGMPGKETYEILSKIEEEMLDKLKDHQGYLNIGRQTADSNREIYFACKDFRLPSKVMVDISHKYSTRFEMDFDIYKDKYWKSLERFTTQ